MKRDLILTLEKNRLALQARLDCVKSQSERNFLGQFATPTVLAHQIAAHGVSLLPPDSQIRFLDPGMGTGAFFSALLHTVSMSRISFAQGFEIDPHYGDPGRHLWENTSLRVELKDFTKAHPPDTSSQFNLILANPPYVRHHHLSKEEKDRLQSLVKKIAGVSVQGLAGLYCYFMLLSHAWLAPNGVAGWLIPSEFMDVNYGNSLKQYLLDKVTLLQIHRFNPDDVQFDDALVSSSIVWFRKHKPVESHHVVFTYGGTLNQPSISKDIPLHELRNEPKWTRFPLLNSRTNNHTATLGDFFTIKRGIATGGNNFFILKRSEIENRKLPISVFRPLLPSPRHLQCDEVTSDTKGCPMIEPQLYLLDCHFSEDDIQSQFPELASYLESGKNDIAQGYICRHRSPWYSQEQRPPAPILCTYIGRTNTRNGRAFRFILNHSKATALNVYLMLYPKPILAAKFRRQPHILREVWDFLNNIDIATLLEEGRVYGGGMHKMEPKELARVPAEGLLNFVPEMGESFGMQMEFFR